MVHPTSGASHSSGQTQSSAAAVGGASGRATTLFNLIVGCHQNRTISEKVRQTKLISLITQSLPLFSQYDALGISRIFQITLQEKLEIPEMITVFAQSLSEKTSDCITQLQDPRISIEDALGILSASTRLGISNPALYNAVAEMSLSRIQEYSLENIRDLAGYFSVVGIRNERLLQAISDSVRGFLQRSAISDVVSHLETLSNFSESEELYSELSRSAILAIKNHSLSPNEIVAIAAHFGKHKIQSPSTSLLFGHIAEEVVYLENQKSTFTAVSFVSLVRSFATLSQSYKPLFDLIEEKTKPHFKELSLHQLERFLWSFKQLGFCHSGLYNECSQEVISKIQAGESVTPRQMALISLTFFNPSFAVNEDLVKIVKDKSLALMNQFSHHEIALLSFAFSKIHTYDETLFAAMIHRTCKCEVSHLIGFEDLHLQVKAFNKLKVQSRKFFDFISKPSLIQRLEEWQYFLEDSGDTDSFSEEMPRSIREKIRSVHPSCIIDIMYAFSDLDCLDESLFKDISLRLLSSVSALTIKDLSLLLHALSRSFSQESNTLCNTIETELLQNQRLQKSENEDLMDMANAITLRPYPSTKMLEAFAQEIMARLSTFSSAQLQEISIIFSRSTFGNKELFYRALERVFLEKNFIKELSSEGFAEMTSAFGEAGIGSASFSELCACEAIRKIGDFDIFDLSKMFCFSMSESFEVFPSRGALLQAIKERIYVLARNASSQEILKYASPKDLIKVAKTLEFCIPEKRECLGLWKVLIFSMKSQVSRLDIPTLQEVTILFGSISLPEALSQPLFMAFSREWVGNQKLSSLSFDEAILVAKSYVDKGMNDIPFFDMISKRSVADISSGSIKSLALLSNTFIFLGIETETLFQAVEKELAVPQKWDRADPEDLVHLAYGFSRSKRENPVILMQIATLSVSTLSQFDYSHLLDMSAIFYGLTMITTEKEQLLQAIEREITRREASENFSAQDMVAALSILIVIRSQNYSLIHRLLDRTRPYIESVEGDDLASLVYSLSLSTIKDADLLDHVIQGLLSKIYSVQWKNLQKILISLTKLELDPPKTQALAQAVVDALAKQEKILEVSSEELTQLAQTFLDLHLLHHPFLEALAREFLEKYQRYTNAMLCSLLKVFLHAEFSPPLKMQIYSCIMDKLYHTDVEREFSLEQIISVVELLHTSHPRSAEISRCLEKLAEVLSSKTSLMDVVTLEKVAIMYKQTPPSSERAIVKLYGSIALALAKKEMARTLSPGVIIEWVNIFGSVYMEPTILKKLYETFAEVLPKDLSYFTSANISIDRFVEAMATIEMKGTASTQFIVGLAKTWEKAPITTEPNQKTLFSLFYALVHLHLEIKGRQALLKKWLEVLTKPQNVSFYSPNQISTMVSCISEIPMARKELWPLINPLLEGVTLRGFGVFSYHNLLEILVAFRKLSITAREWLPEIFQKMEREFEQLSLHELSVVADQLGRLTHSNTPAEQPFANSLRESTAKLWHHIMIKVQDHITELAPEDLANIASSFKEVDAVENTSELNSIFISKAEELLKLIPSTLKEKPFHPESYARVIESFAVIPNREVFFQKPKISVIRYLAPLVTPQYLGLVSQHLKDFASCDLLKILIGSMQLEINNEPFLDSLTAELLTRASTEIPTGERGVYIENLGKLVDRKSNLYRRFSYFPKMVQIGEKLKSLPNT